MAEKNRDTYNAYMRVYMLARYRRRKKAARAFLGGKCVVCGTTRRLEFDHRDRTSKYKVIADMWSYSEKRFWEEVVKCQLLCNKHHRVKSLEERGFKAEKGVHGTAGNYYRYGCRCVRCWEANSKQQRVWREK